MVVGDHDRVDRRQVAPARPAAGAAGAGRPAGTASSARSTPGRTAPGAPSISTSAEECPYQVTCRPSGGRRRRGRGAQRHRPAGRRRCPPPQQLAQHRPAGARRDHLGRDGVAEGTVAELRRPAHALGPGAARRRTQRGGQVPRRPGQRRAGHRGSGQQAPEGAPTRRAVLCRHAGKCAGRRAGRASVRWPVRAASPPRKEKGQRKNGASGSSSGTSSPSSGSSSTTVSRPPDPPPSPPSAAVALVSTPMPGTP